LQGLENGLFARRRAGHCRRGATAYSGTKFRPAKNFLERRRQSETILNAPVREIGADLSPRIFKPGAIDEKSPPTLTTTHQPRSATEGVWRFPDFHR